MGDGGVQIGGVVEKIAMMPGFLLSLGGDDFPAATGAGEMLSKIEIHGKVESVLLARKGDRGHFPGVGKP